MAGGQQLARSVSGAQRRVSVGSSEALPPSSRTPCTERTCLQLVGRSCATLPHAVPHDTSGCAATAPTKQAASDGELIESGGQAAVYKQVHPVHGPVAMKVIPQGKGSAAACERKCVRGRASSRKRGAACRRDGSLGRLVLAPGTLPLRLRRRGVLGRATHTSHDACRCSRRQAVTPSSCWSWGTVTCTMLCHSARSLALPSRTFAGSGCCRWLMVRGSLRAGPRPGEGGQAWPAVHRTPRASCRSCAGLCHAHSCGIAHRDLKPENLLLFRANPSEGGASPVRAASAHSSSGSGADARRRRGGELREALDTWRRGQRTQAMGRNIADRFVAKVCDFGSAFVTPSKSPPAQPRGHAACGSTKYSPPEVRRLMCMKMQPKDAAKVWPEGTWDAARRLGYDPFAADVWAFAVIVYVATMGSRPWRYALIFDASWRAFVRTQQPDTMSEAVCGPGHALWTSKHAQAAEPAWAWPASMSPALRDLLQKCLRVRPEERPTMKQVLQHPWFVDPTWTPARQGVAPPLHIHCPSAVSTASATDVTTTESPPSEASPSAAIPRGVVSTPAGVKHAEGALPPLVQGGSSPPLHRQGPLATRGGPLVSTQRSSGGGSSIGSPSLASTGSWHARSAHGRTLSWLRSPSRASGADSLVTEDAPSEPSTSLPIGSARSLPHTEVDDAASAWSSLISVTSGASAGPATHRRSHASSMGSSSSPASVDHTGKGPGAVDSSVRPVVARAASGTPWKVPLWTTPAQAGQG